MQSQQHQFETQEQLITSPQQLMNLYLSIQQKCADIQDFKDPGMTNQQIITKLLLIQKCIQKMSIFSQNQKITDIHTQYLKYLCLPYHIGYIFGKISTPRKQSVIQSKNYLNAFLNLCQLFNCEDEEVFPKNALNLWKNHTTNQAYKPTREQLVTNMKQKKIIQQRYQNNTKIKDIQQQRQSIKDFITLQIYQSISQLRMIEQQLMILNYKQSITKDEKARQKHEQQMNKPIPKLKHWQIKAPQQLNQQILSQMPKGLSMSHTHQHTCTHKQQLIAQVWQQNANKPTMSLQQVGQLQYQNMMQRTERQKKQRQENKVDTDSDKEENDDREKKKARQWDDWKDQHEKGAGNKNKSYR